MPKFVNFNRKAWVASIAPIAIMFIMATITAGFGLEIPGLEVFVTAVITGALTWAVPNES